jgi:hypothetical protein
MKTLIATTFLFLLSSPAMAENVVARSGEHDSFSRIVLEFSQEQEWRMGRTASGYQIQFSTSELDIDLTDVYAKIPKTRIKQIEFNTAQTALTLDMGCECHANAFQINGTKLVIDMKDGTAPKDSAFEVALDEVAPRSVQNIDVSTARQPIIILQPTAQNRGDVELEAEEARVASQGVDGVESELEQAKRHARERMLTPKKTSTNTLPLLLNTFPTEKPAEPQISDNSDATSQRLETMERSLLDQIGRAATQGLLAVDLEIPKPEPLAAPEPVEPVVVEVEPAEAPKPSAQTHIQLHAQTSIDRGIRDAFTRNLPVSVGRQDTACLPDYVFDIASWGNDNDAISGIADARARLMGEFDIVSAEASEQLIKAYLYVGFGSEARQALMTLDATPAHADILAAMSDIMDLGMSPTKSSLPSQIECSSPGAMWAVLAMPKIPSDVSIDLASVKSAFSALPLHLRRHLGPELLKRFIDVHDQQTSIELRNAITRAGGKLNDSLVLRDAQIDIQVGQAQLAQEKLADIAGNRSMTAVEAQLLLVFKQIENGESIPQPILLSLEALAFEHRESPVETQVLIAISMAHANNGDHQAAIETAISAASEGIISASEENDLVKFAFAAIVATPDDQAFLKQVFRNVDLVTSYDIPIPVKKEMAARLLEHELPDLTVEVLGTSEARDTEEAILLARTAILQRRPEHALSLTAGIIDDLEATNIRLQAANQMGNHALAARELARLNEPRAAEEAIWRSGELNTLAPDTSPYLANAAALMQPETLEPQAEALPTIAMNKDRLSKSQEARKVMTDLLSAFQNPKPALVN